MAFKSHGSEDPLIAPVWVNRHLRYILPLGYDDIRALFLTEMTRYYTRPALIAAESDFRPVLGDAVGSPQNREHEMGDPVALDADRRAAEQDVF